MKEEVFFFLLFFEKKISGMTSVFLSWAFWVDGGVNH